VRFLLYIPLPQSIQHNQTATLSRTRFKLWNIVYIYMYIYMCLQNNTDYTI
jgi:hypothetical protein